MYSKAGCNLPKASKVVCARIYSSLAKMSKPLRSFIGIMDLWNLLLAQAAAALFWDSTAKLSTSFREYPYLVAIKSAEIPCGTNLPKAASGSITQAEPSMPIGTRDMDSTPPATIKSDHPDLTRAAA